jgi:hypothetical protein
VPDRDTSAGDVAGCYTDPDGDGNFACWGNRGWMSGWVFGLHDLSTQPPAFH